jgi:hypothetical protein
MEEEEEEEEKTPLERKVITLFHHTCNLLP